MREEIIRATPAMLLVPTLQISQHSLCWKEEVCVHFTCVSVMICVHIVCQCECGLCDVACMCVCECVLHDCYILAAK